MAATRTCPRCQAESVAADYCDTCGVAIICPESTDPAGAVPTEDTLTIAGSSTPAQAGLVAAGFRCGHCGTGRAPGDAFCEVCGFDFKTGRMPQAPAPAQPVQAPHWTLLIGADRQFYESNRDLAERPVVFPDDLEPREVPLTGTELVVGRRDEARGFLPDIDLSRPVADLCVSRRHAVLRHQADGSWTLVDEGSTNGTWINGASAPVKARELVTLHDGDRIFLGAFTVLVLRDDGEQGRT